MKKPQGTVESKSAPKRRRRRVADAAPAVPTWRDRLVGWPAVAAFALVVRLAYLLTANGPAFEHPILDADYYDFLGERLANGLGFPEEPFWQPPFYPLLLGRLYALFGHTLLVPRLFQAALGAATAALCCEVASRLTEKKWAGIVAGVLVALHGPLVFYDGEILPTSLAAFVAALVMWMATLVHQSTKIALCIGAAVGIGALSVAPLLLLLLPAAWAVASGRSLRPLVCAAAALLVIAPATLTNHARSGEWILISANGGVNLWLGNNADADRTVAIRPGAEWEALVAEPERRGIQSPGAQSDYFVSKALSWCGSAPLACAKNLLHKGRLLLVSRDLPRNEDLYVAREQSPVLAALTLRMGGAALPWALLWPAALAGAAIALQRRRRADLVVVATALALAAPSVVFFVTGRYRAPLAPALCVLAAVCVVSMVEQRGRLPTAPLAVAALAIAVWPVRVATDHVDFRAELHYAVGGRLARFGDDEGAARALRRALELRPNYLEAGINLALLLERQGRPLEAASTYEHVLRHHPDSLEARLGLARARGTGD